MGDALVFIGSYSTTQKRSIQTTLQRDRFTHRIYRNLQLLLKAIQVDGERSVMCVSTHSGGTVVLPHDRYTRTPHPTSSYRDLF